MIGIRADANSVIASGHIMRCIAIAEQLVAVGETVIFITADHFSDALLDEKGWRHICLNSDWNDKDTEIEDMKAVISYHEITLLLVDSYQVTKKYLQTFGGIVKIAYIDDLYMFEYPVDVIINYAPGVKYELYEAYRSKSVKFLLGPEYVPLRKEFQKPPIRINSKVNDVLITTGGSDNNHFVHRIVCKIAKMEEFSRIRFHIILGGFFSYEDGAALEAIGCYSTNIIVHRNVRNMADIMRQCDMAVSAGGTTLAELCAVGLPAICFAIADNQIEGVSAFGKNGVMDSAGDISGDIIAGVDKVVEKIMYLKDDYEMRKHYSLKGRTLIDGGGALRIAEELKRLAAVRD